jgi:predicted DsbA family dithiol-disulfide isomerase
MRIEIWSDIACPWCYLGKRRFEAALTRFEGKEDVEVVWRSFELDPDAPKSYGVSTVEHLAQKYRVTTQRATEMNEHLTATAALDGLNYRLDLARPGNTFDAHRLAHHASEEGHGEVMMERLMRAYLTEGASMSDPDTLVKLATEVGLDEKAAREVVEGNKYASEVRGDEQRAYSLGVEGVPFFVIDDRFGISGAQPADLLLNAMRSIAANGGADVEERHSEAQCDAEGCAAHDH